LNNSNALAYWCQFVNYDKDGKPNILSLIDTISLPDMAAPHNKKRLCQQDFTKVRFFQDGHIKIADFGMCKEKIDHGATTKVILKGLPCIAPLLRITRNKVPYHTTPRHTTHYQLSVRLFQ
jgi:hypothetical protein